MARARRRRRQSLLSPRLLLVLVLGVLGVAAYATLQPGGLGGPASPPAGAGPTVPVRPTDADVAHRRLVQLPVAEPRPGGYQRTRDFGPAWSYDFDHNGCRERDDVLRRDLTEVRRRDRCAVVSGVLADPYSGATVRFRREAADEVQIDHVFPLAAAWAHGARSWTAQVRLHFANDPRNLLATTAAANQAKSDSTPAEWQPRAGFRCAYAVRYIDVATHYRLSVSASDRRTLAAMLDRCPP